MSNKRARVETNSRRHPKKARVETNSGSKNKIPIETSLGSFRAFAKYSRHPALLKLQLQEILTFTGEVDAMKLSPTEKKLINDPNWDWPNVCFVLPDRSNMDMWVKKADEQHKKGCTVAILLPCRTSAGWFHKYVLGHASKIIFVEGRLIIPPKKKSASEADCVAIFEAGKTGCTLSGPSLKMGQDIPNAVDVPKDHGFKTSMTSTTDRMM